MPPAPLCLRRLDLDQGGSRPRAA